MGEDEFELRVALGEGLDLVEWGVDFAGVVVAGGFCDVHVDWPVVFDSPFDDFDPSGVIELKALDGWEDFAEALEAVIVEPFKVFGSGVASERLDGGEGDDFAWVFVSEFSYVFIVPDAGGMVLPVPAESEDLGDVGSCHVCEELFFSCPALEGFFWTLRSY